MNIQLSSLNSKIEHDLNIINEGDYSAQLSVELSNGIIMESNILNLKFIISSSEYKNSSLNDILLKQIEDEKIYGTKGIIAPMYTTNIHNVDFNIIIEETIII